MLGLSSPTREQTHAALHWKHGALTTGPSEKSSKTLNAAYKHTEKPENNNKKYYYHMMVHI